MTFTFTISLIWSNYAYAEPAFKVLDFKLTHDPTICVLETDDKTIPEAGRKLSRGTENAILDWQTKLKDTTRQRDGWNLVYREIKLKEVDTFDFSNCDIQVHFKSQPDKKEDKFNVVGVTQLDPKTLAPIIEIYYSQIDPGIQRRESMDYDANILWYWYESNPKYLDILRTDDQLASTIRHELGHSFGLGHYMTYDKTSNDNWKSGRLTPPSIMIPILPDFSARVGITPEDIDKMISIYGRQGFGDKQESQEGDKIHTIQTPYLLKSYDSKKLGFSIKYPTDWYVDFNQNIGQSDSVVTFADSLSYYYGFLNVEFVKNNEDKITNDAEYLDSMTQLEKDYCEEKTIETDGLTCSNFTILDSKTTEINSIKAYQIKYFKTLIYQSGDVFPLVSIKTEIPVGGNLWIIYAESDSTLYSDFAGELDSSINSFKVNSDDAPLVTNNPKNDTQTKPIEKNEPLETPAAPTSMKNNTETKEITKNDSSEKSTMPLWIKNNAKWWADGQIDDNTFVSGIQFMVKNKIINVSQNLETSEQSEQKIPNWVKNNAKWWSEDQITETDFTKGIEHLVKIGIIKVK